MLNPEGFKRVKAFQEISQCSLFFGGMFFVFWKSWPLEISLHTHDSKPTHTNMHSFLWTSMFHVHTVW